MSALGPVMVDLAGTELGADEREMLAHPLVGGLILFARNYESPRQLLGLTAAIHAARDPALLIAVDHEGGRVQRFREGFTAIPPMRQFGALHETNPALALRAAEYAGYVIAHELLAHGVDFSFAPLLDVDFGSSSVIGDRAFSSDPVAIAGLAHALITGLAAAGMAAVGKHFPGHGFVRADSHSEVPIDERTLAVISAADLVPYRALIGRGLAGIMPAHVIYPQVDPQPAGFSRRWLSDILRRQLGFEGMVFSDDLSMAGASIAGAIEDRARAALEAGCDMVLVCNAPESAGALLETLDAVPLDAARAQAMRGRHKPDARRCAEAIAQLDAAFG